MVYVPSFRPLSSPSSVVTVSCPSLSAQAIKPGDQNFRTVTSMSTQILKSTSIDDTDGNVTYVPTGQWTVHTNVEPIFHLYDSTDTFTGIQNATATVRFYGNAIEYWGNQGPAHGPCIVSVDGKQMATVNSYASVDDVPILLYSKNDLTLGDHILEVRVSLASGSNICEIDRFVANITSVASTTSGSSNQPSSTGYSNGNTTSPVNGGGKSSTPVAAIAAGVAGGVALCVFLLGLWLYIRSRKIRAEARRANSSKPLLLGDEPGSPVPQAPSFYQTDYNRPASFAPSSAGQPSTYPTFNPGITLLPPPGVAVPAHLHPNSSYAQSQSSSSSPPTDGQRSSMAPLTSMPSSEYPPEKGPGSRMFNANPTPSSPSVAAGPSVRQPIVMTPETAANEVPPPAYDA